MVDGAGIQIIGAAGGRTVRHRREVTRRTGNSKTCLWHWQVLFMQQSFEGLLPDKRRPSCISPFGAAVAAPVVALARTGATYWTGTMTVKETAISASSVQRIWRAHGLRPHRLQQLKLY